MNFNQIAHNLGRRRIAGLTALIVSVMLVGSLVGIGMMSNRASGAAATSAGIGLKGSKIVASCAGRVWFHTRNTGDYEVGIETVVGSNVKSRLVPAHAVKDVIRRGEPGDRLALNGPVDAGAVVTAVMPARCDDYSTTMKFNPVTGLSIVVFHNNTDRARYGKLTTNEGEHWLTDGPVPAHGTAPIKIFFNSGTVLITSFGEEVTNVRKMPQKPE